MVLSRKEKFTNSLLDMDLNSSTTSMIDDIINSFESKVSKSKDANPMESIMEITDLIANKYSESAEYKLIIINLKKLSKDHLYDSDISSDEMKLLIDEDTA